MKQQISESELNQQVLTYSKEIIAMEEPPILTSYLWLKIQKVAEVMIAKDKLSEEHSNNLIDVEIYRSVMNRKRINLKRIIQLRRK